MLKYSEVVEGQFHWPRKKDLDIVPAVNTTPDFLHTFMAVLTIVFSILLHSCMKCLCDIKIFCNLFGNIFLCSHMCWCFSLFCSKCSYHTDTE